MSLLLASLLAVASGADVPAVPRGAMRTTVPIHRPWRGADRLFVEASLPDGHTALFLVDTGAATSTLTPAAADRLALPRLAGEVTVAGVSALATVEGATLPWIAIGGVVVPDVDVAVDVPGVQDVYGHMPIDGILGGNVWSRFVVDLDLRADTLALRHRPPPGLAAGATPLTVASGRPLVEVRFVPAAGPGDVHAVTVLLDTAADGLLLRGPDDPTLAGAFTDGLERLGGLGAPEPELRRTRRIPLASLAVGGVALAPGFEARWIGWDGGDDGAHGLLGHDALEGRRVVLDYPGGRLRVAPSHRPPAFHDGHAAVLARDVAAWGDAPERWLIRAGLLLGLGRLDEAGALLGRLVASPDPAVAPDQPAARVLLARLRRHRGDAEGALSTLAPLPAEVLVDQGELVDAVDGLRLEGRRDEAWDLLLRARALRPDAPSVAVAEADLRLEDGDAAGARAALDRVATLPGSPDVDRLRAARAATAAGDHDGALALLREGLLRDPLEGRYLWMYAQLAPRDDPRWQDLLRAAERVQASARPLLGLTGAWALLGRPDDARRTAADGLARDCAPLDDPAAVAACTARYWGASRQRLDEALRALDEALATRGPTADLLDARATVLVARGDLDAARAALSSALRLSPADPWLQWRRAALAPLARAPAHAPHDASP